MPRGPQFSILGARPAAAVDGPRSADLVVRLPKAVSAAEIRRFVLKEDLVPGTAPTSAAAYPVWRGGGAWQNSQESWDEFTVYDLAGLLRGREFDEEVWTSRIGRAILMGDTRHWEILDLPQQARFIEVTAAGAFTTSTAHFSATIDSYWDGYDPGSDPIDVSNKTISGGGYLFEGAAGSKGIARYDVWDDVYRLVQWECP